MDEDDLSFETVHGNLLDIAEGVHETNEYDDDEEEEDEPDIENLDTITGIRV